MIIVCRQTIFDFAKPYGRTMNYLMKASVFELLLDSGKYDNVVTTCYCAFKH